MTRAEFLERVLRGASSWEQHGWAAWMMTRGFHALGMPSFDWKARVEQHVGEFWRWKVTCHHTQPATDPDGIQLIPLPNSAMRVRTRSDGLVRSMDEGKQACTVAIHRIAELAIFKEGAVYASAAVEK